MKSASRKLGSAFAMYAGLPKPVYALFVATVVNGAGIFVFPFLTLFLTKRLGMDVREAGRIMLLTSLAYLPGAVLGGKIADARGRKALAIGAQALAALCYLPCGLFALRPELSLGLDFLGLSGRLGARELVPALVLVNVLFDGFSDPARSSMHTDLTTPENRQAAFSLNYLGHNLGFAVGPLVAGFLFNAAPAWLFWGNALAAFAACAVVLFAVPETKPDAEALRASLANEGSTERAHEGGLLSAIRSRPRLVAFVLLNSCLGFVYAQHRFALPLHADALLGAGGAKIYGVVMTMNALLVLALTTPLIALLKGKPAVYNVAVSAGLYALGFGMLAFAGGPAIFLVSAAVWTAGEIVNATNAEVYVANHTPMSHRGRFNAVLPVLGGLGWSLSTPVGGKIIHRFGMGALWAAMFGVAAAAGLGLALLGRGERTAASRASAIDAASEPRQAAQLPASDAEY